MEAPAKIYIQTNAGETLSSKWTTIPFRDFENTAYIRKNALLEWLEQEVLKLDVRSDNDAVAWGQRNAFKQAIDKLNSM